MTTSFPHHCPRCRDTESFYGRLLFEDEVKEIEAGTIKKPTCPNHKDEVVRLVPSGRKKS